MEDDSLNSQGENGWYEKLNVASSSKADEQESGLLASIAEDVQSNKKKAGPVHKHLLVKAVSIVLVLLVVVMVAGRPILRFLNIATNGLTFIEARNFCTNDNDGVPSGLLFLASGDCMQLEVGSMDNGCTSGTFNFYNSRDCTGPIRYSLPLNTCASPGPNTPSLIMHCSTYNDETYLRFRFYKDNGNPGDCTSSLGMVAFIRFDFCYQMVFSRLNDKLEKINETAIRTMTYPEAGCSSDPQTSRDVLADGACFGNRRLDIVSASDLTN